jgi:hypothetical protein
MVVLPNRSFNRTRHRHGFYRMSEHKLVRSFLRQAGTPVNLVR